MDKESNNQVEGSLIMPCLNEAKTLPRCIGKANTVLVELGINSKIIVADNGSIDDSREIAES